MNLRFVPILDEAGEVQLFDCYVDGTWIGSRRKITYFERRVVEQLSDPELFEQKLREAARGRPSD